MWTYRVDDGWMLSPKGTRFAEGYSGAPGAVNDSTKQSLHNVGPIPDGMWTIGEPYYDDETGPYTLPLVPDNGTNTFGRSGFRIHGDDVVLAGLEKASKGCIVLGRPAREAIWNSGDRELRTVSD